MATIGVVVWSWNNRKNRPDVFFAVGAFLGTIVVWIALFPNHVYIHEYQALIAAPLICIGLGVVLKAAGELNGPVRIMATLVAPLIMVVPLVRHTAALGFNKPQPNAAIEYAKDIERNTTTSAVVLSPLDSMVPVYYSNRHIIRSVSDDEALRSVMRQTGSVFPGSECLYCNSAR